MVKIYFKNMFYNLYTASFCLFTQSGFSIYLILMHGHKIMAFSLIQGREFMPIILEQIYKAVKYATASRKDNKNKGGFSNIKQGLSDKEFFQFITPGLFR